MRRTITTWAWTLLVVFAAHGRAQTISKDCCQSQNFFFGRRTSKPITKIGGFGGEIFLYKGFAVGADVATTRGNPDKKIKIRSYDISYHYPVRLSKFNIEPFFAVGGSHLAGYIKDTRIYPNDPGQVRNGANFSGGLAFWPVKWVGLRVEGRLYTFPISYGALENVVPGGGIAEVRIGFTVQARSKKGSGLSFHLW